MIILLPQLLFLPLFGYKYVTMWSFLLFVFGFGVFCLFLCFWFFIILEARIKVPLGNDIGQSNPDEFDHPSPNPRSQSVMNLVGLPFGLNLSDVSNTGIGEMPAAPS